MSFDDWCDGPMPKIIPRAISNPVENPPRHQIHEFRWDDASQRFQEVGQAQASQTLTEGQDDTHPNYRYPNPFTDDPLGSLWDPRSNKTYTHRDVNVMYDALDHFFQKKDQLRAAQDVYYSAVKIPGTSPVDAFRQAAMMSALARQLDTSDAHLGGLMYHLGSLRDVRDAIWSSSEDYHLSPDSVEDLRNAKALRKVQEIKKIMATNHLENVGGPIMENLQFRPANVRGPGAHARAEVAAVSSGGMNCDTTDDFKNEDDVKDEAMDEVKDEAMDEVKDEAMDDVKDEDETMTELRLGDNWVIVKPEDANAPESS